MDLEIAVLEDLIKWAAKKAAESTDAAESLTGAERALCYNLLVGAADAYDGIALEIRRRVTAMRGAG